MKSATRPCRFENAGSRVAVLQHEPQTGLGVFSGLLDKAGVDYEVLETSGAAPLPDIACFDGAIVLGGSLGADEPALLEERRWIRDAVLRATPLLGICLGGQLLARALGGFVGRGSRPEVGITDVFLTDAAKRDPLFGDLPGRFPALAWHADAFSLPRARSPWPARSPTSIRHSASARVPTRCSSTPRCGRRISTVGPLYPAYVQLLERAGAEWDDVVFALERARPELDALAEQLLESWLCLVTEVAAARGRSTRVAA
jgi:GMP synthase-like glutamine amidotransferase